MTLELDPTVRGSSPLPRPRDICSGYSGTHAGSPFQGRTLMADVPGPGAASTVSTCRARWALPPAATSLVVSPWAEQRARPRPPRPRPRPAPTAHAHPRLHPGLRPTPHGSRPHPHPPRLTLRAGPAHHPSTHTPSLAPREAVSRPQETPL